MRAVTYQRMNLCISDLIVETGAIGTGKPQCQNAFGSAAPAFSFAPGCQGDASRRMGGGRRTLLATGRAIGRCAGLEEPLASGDGGGGLKVRPQLQPVPEQPKQEEASHQLNQHQSTNILFLITREREKAGASRKDSEARPGRQVARRRSMELSTISRGRTVSLSLGISSFPAYQPMPMMPIVMFDLT